MVLTQQQRGQLWVKLAGGGGRRQSHFPRKLRWHLIADLLQTTNGTSNPIVLPADCICLTRSRSLPISVLMVCTWTQCWFRLQSNPTTFAGCSCCAVRFACGRSLSWRSAGPSIRLRPAGKQQQVVLSESWARLHEAGKWLECSCTHQQHAGAVLEAVLQPCLLAAPVHDPAGAHHCIFHCRSYQPNTRFCAA